MKLVTLEEKDWKRALVGTFERNLYLPAKCGKLIPVSCCSLEEEYPLRSLRVFIPFWALLGNREALNGTLSDNKLCALKRM